MADPVKRKAHVKRIWKSNDDGTPNKNVWVDVLRLDDLPVDFQGTDLGIRSQTVKFKFSWQDDASNPSNPGNVDPTNPQQENINTSRKTRRLYVKNPKFPDDDTQTNTLWIVDKAKITMPQGSPFGLSGQIVNFAFGNANLYSTRSADPPYDEDAILHDRKVSVIKVVSNDLGGFGMEDGDKSKIVDWDTYKEALKAGKNNANKDQHLDVEVTDSFKIEFGADAKTGVRGQIVKYVLGANDEVEKLFDEGDPDAVDDNGFPSVIRTDPLQTIVNAKLVSPGPVFIHAVCEVTDGLALNGPRAGVSCPASEAKLLDANQSGAGTYLSFWRFSEFDVSTPNTSPKSDIVITGKVSISPNPLTFPDWTTYANFIEEKIVEGTSTSCDFKIMGWAFNGGGSEICVKHAPEPDATGNIAYGIFVDQIVPVSTITMSAVGVTVTIRKIKYSLTHSRFDSKTDNLGGTRIILTLTFEPPKK